ncbi:hypothetical protein B0H14DRAFT_2650969 [Mycena olivaceomarginata]|nr:hypothetical protein B0H14DRAFT_2650969 [Mycena olivaceomarginata]
MGIGVPGVRERSMCASDFQLIDDAYWRRSCPRRTSSKPCQAHFKEDFATNAGLDAADFGYTMGDTSWGEEQAPEDDGISVRVKAKHYQNSDLPFQTWVNHRDKYLDEMLWGEGRGNPTSIRSAWGCGVANPVPLRAADMLRRWHVL